MDRKVKGFSLGEILIVMLIISVLAYIGYREITKSVADQRLKNSAQTLVTNLERIKGNSVTGGVPWGISINSQNTSSYILFEDTNKNCKLDDNNPRTVALEQEITFQNTPSRTIVFDRKGTLWEHRNGKCEPIQERINMVLSNSFGRTATITIERSGVVRYAY